MAAGGQVRGRGDEQIPKRNGWTIAAQAGDRAPDKTQRLLSRAVWDTFAAMGVVRRFAVAGLDEAAAKTGRRRALSGRRARRNRAGQGRYPHGGVKRQYLGCVGKVANGINTVHLAYVREGTGHALIGAREWIPAEQLNDPAARRSWACRRAWSSAPRGSWPSTSSPRPSPTAWAGLRVRRRGLRLMHPATRVLRTPRPGLRAAIPSSFRLTLSAGITLPAAGRRPAGPRAWLGDPLCRERIQRRALVRLGVAGHRLARHHLLIRRHLATGELAFHYCDLPEGRPASPSRPVRAAGLRGRPKKISSSGRTVSGWTSPRSACTPRLPGTPCWSWRPWPSVPSPPPCSAAAPAPPHRPQRSQTSPGQPSSG